MNIGTCVLILAHTYLYKLQKLIWTTNMTTSHRSKCLEKVIGKLPSQVILAAWRPIRMRLLLSSRPSFNRWIPSFVILLWPRFRVSMACVATCKQKLRLNYDYPKNNSITLYRNGTCFYKALQFRIGSYLDIWHTWTWYTFQHVGVDWWFKWYTYQHVGHGLVV